jgi:integrase/recombinase XerC
MDSISQFLAELAVQRRASAHTISAYRRDLTHLAKLGEDDQPDALTSAQLQRALMQMHSKSLAPRSIARTLSAWRSFYGWLERNERISTNPALTLRAPRRPHLLPKALGVDQAAALLDAKLGTRAIDPLALRDSAMFELFYSSGLRLAELVSLSWPGGLDLETGEVTVTGKRNKTRIVPVGERALTALKEWISVRAAMSKTNETALFIGQRGTRLTPRQVQTRLAQWAQKSGLGMHVHPHMLRHSFASHVLQSSGDLRAVQDMLGHASIAATQVYTHLDFQHLAKIYDSAHPRAKKA